MAHRDHRAETERRVTRDLPERRVFKDNQDQWDPQVLPDQLANKVKEVKGESEEITDLWVRREPKASQDHLDLKERKVHQESMERREIRDGPVYQACKDHQDHPDLQENLVAKEHPDHQDNRAFLDQEVSQAKTVLQDRLVLQACRDQEEPWAMTAQLALQDLLVHQDHRDHRAMRQSILVTLNRHRPKDQTLTAITDISMTNPSTVKI